VNIHNNGVLLRELLDYAFDPAVLASRLQMQYEVLRQQVTRMSNAMQQVQHRRLAVDYLDKNTMFKIFSQAKFRAKSAACNVLVNHPSQLTQLETSYVYDGKKASLILHIPIAPEESTMRLYKMHPFPLPFTNDTFLIPNVRDDVLAISNTSQRFTMQLSSIDLLGCHHMGHTYLCE